MYLPTNNSRRMHGLPLHRKTDKRKRYYTRCKAAEVVSALLDYFDGKTVYHDLSRKKEGDCV